MRMKTVISSLLIFSAATLTFAFVNCAGSGGGSSPQTAQADTGNLESLDQLYIGSYQEDKLTNPEDPSTGTVYLNIPASGEFSGQMFFTYMGCQSSNVGVISGTHAKIGNQDTLSGSWGGNIDGTEQAGSFAGSWIAASNAFMGQYTVTGGKQHISVEDCIEYYIAPRGTFSLWKVGENAPASLNMSASGDGVSWKPLNGATWTVLSLLDAQAALQNSNQAVIFQTMLPAALTQFSWDEEELVRGKRYIAVILILNSSSQVVGHGSLPFIK